MAAITIEVDLPPDVTITAYQRHGQGHGFEVSWPLPSRVRCDHCRREEKAYLEYKNGVQVDWSVNCYMPIEGYHLAFNGKGGRIPEETKQGIHLNRRNKE